MSKHPTDNQMFNNLEIQQHEPTQNTRGNLGYCKGAKSHSVMFRSEDIRLDCNYDNLEHMRGYLLPRFLTFSNAG